MFLSDVSTSCEQFSKQKARRRLSKSSVFRHREGNPNVNLCCTHFAIDSHTNALII
jgi:hypothetical protein